ncbi:MAG: TonB-dependent receptor [Prevotella sp.]|nr:TonB-dependent receptor [Prevotella sp.]
MKRKSIISLCLGLLMSLCTIPAMAQNQVVTGTVVDEMNEPIIGATVRVEGTKTATVTDFDGNYKIEVPKNGKITVSYIGYKEVATKGGQLKLEPDSNDLQEVVVVGYGTQKKAHLTGSVATVDMDDVQDLTNGSLGASLSGLVNGLSVSNTDSRPGERVKMYIRDASTMSEIGSTAQEPLYVIDGFIYPNDVKVGRTYQNLGAEAFNNLDASEIESISVLKDASAAVYGARAANGVILVTTKKGKQGAPSISYSGSFGWTDAVAHPTMLNSYDYGRLYNISAAAKDIRNNSLNPLTDLYQADELEAMKGLNYDLIDKYWKTGFTQRHAVNVSGATEKVNYFAGISYFDQDGNLGKMDYNRWNYRAGVDVKINKWLSANLGVSGDYGKKDRPLSEVVSSSKEYGTLLTRPTYIPEYVGGYPISPWGISNNGGTNSDFKNYSYDVLQNNGDYSKNMSSNLNINASVKVDMGFVEALKGLTASFSYSKSINTDKNNEYGSKYNMYYMTKRYGSGSHLYTPTTGDVDGFDYLSESNLAQNKMTLSNGDRLTRTMSRADTYQMNFTLNYARDFGKHHVGALFSIEKSESESENNYSYVSEPYDFTTYQSSSAVASTKDVEFTRAESGSLSYIGRINYAYDNRYLFEFLIRSDASTKFAPENYWGTFPAFSLGWVASEEPWFQNVKWLKWVDFLKLRFSWGLTGRDNAEPWQWMQVYSQKQDGGVVFGTSGTARNNPIIIDNNTASVNREIHWDKSYKTNIGFDFQVLNKRLAFNFDYYFEKNREMLMRLSQDLPTTIGTRSASTNLGEMNSWGWEFGVTWRDKIGKDFKYRIGLNTGYSDNEVLVMDWVTDYIYRQITPGSRSDIGLWGMQCIGMFRSFQDIEEYCDKYLKKADGTYGTYMGLSKDDLRPGMLIYKDVRGAYNAETGTYDGPNGIVDEKEDMVQLSNRSNPYHFTTNLKAEWKGIALTAQISASWGGYTTVPGSALKAVSGTSNTTLEYANVPSFWNPDNVYVYEDIYDGSGNLIQKANHEAYYPVLANGNYNTVNAATSSFWRVSAAKVSLNRLTLAYTIPQKWVKPIGIKRLSFNVTAQNVINFYNPYPDKFISPMGGTYGNYPALRQWTLGVNLSF